MGQMDVLSVGRGHLRVTVDDKDPASLDSARRMIEDMLKRGFSIFVETDKGLRRVKKFNPARMTYLIDHVPDDEKLEQSRPADGVTPSPSGYIKKKSGRTPKTEVKVSESKSTVVGRTAGG